MLIRIRCWILVMYLVLGFGITTRLHAQSYNYTLLHTFSGVIDGGQPLDGVIIDPSGNLYGTTSTGRPSYGAVYELKQHNGHFTFNILHGFNENEGYSPAGRPFRAQDGTLYGTTQYGGPSNAGTFYHLTPPPTFPRTPLYSWNETILYEFTSNIGGFPTGDLAFDQQGNAYGTTTIDGGIGTSGGSVYELIRDGDDWTPSRLYAFTGGLDGSNPQGGVVFDLSGNLWGTTPSGGQYQYGTVFELVPNGSGWTENTIHQFNPTTDGGAPTAGLILDAEGNLYGDTKCCGTGGSGTAFEITDPGLSFELLFSFDFPGLDSPNCGPWRKLTMDTQGNLYGTTACGGVNGDGSVFELTLSNGGWTYTSLHDFDGSDGSHPESTVTFDASGNLYGTTYAGGPGNCNCGVVWELSPQN